MVYDHAGKDLSGSETFRPYMGDQIFALILLVVPVAATAMRIPVAS